MRRRLTRGSAIVEFGLVAPLLLLLTAGVLDFAMLIRTAASVADAARGGAEYGSRSTASASDTAGIRSAALNASPGITGMTVTPAKTCKCSDGATVSCGGSCISGKMLVYIQVTAQTTAPTVFHYAGLPFTGAVSASASMRVQ
jgi:Flp pilus assembly protein TadG